MCTGIQYVPLHVPGTVKRHAICGTNAIIWAAIAGRSACPNPHVPVPGMPSSRHNGDAGFVGKTALVTMAWILRSVWHGTCNVLSSRQTKWSGAGGRGRTGPALNPPHRQQRHRPPGSPQDDWCSWTAFYRRLPARSPEPAAGYNPPSETHRRPACRDCHVM